MKLIITSTETSVTFTRSQQAVFAKNQVSFEIHPKYVLFRIPGEHLEIKYGDIRVNNIQLTASNAKGLLSDAFFRNASEGDGSGIGGDSNDWNQVDF